MNVTMKRDAARHGDRDIDAMLQSIDGPEASPEGSDQLPSEVIAPITRFGAPNLLSVVPGQSDSDLAAYLAAWMKAKNREIKAAALVYAGQLGSTAPRQEVYSDADAHRAAHSLWLDRCTNLQRRLLSAARDRKAERRRASQRAEYAQMAKDERGVAVREYVTGLSPEERTERRRLQSAQKAKHYRDRKRAEKALCN